MPILIDVAVCHNGIKIVKRIKISCHFKSRLNVFLQNRFTSYTYKIKAIDVKVSNIKSWGKFKLLLIR